MDHIQPVTARFDAVVNRLSLNIGIHLEQHPKTTSFLACGSLARLFFSVLLEQLQDTSLVVKVHVLTHHPEGDQLRTVTHLILLVT